MLNKEIELIIDKFIDKCKEINHAITSKECRSIAEGIISGNGLDKHLVVRALNHQLVKLKRQQHTTIKPTKVKTMTIDEFIATSISSKRLYEIRSSFKGEN